MNALQAVGHISQALREYSEYILDKGEELWYEGYRLLAAKILELIDAGKPYGTALFEALARLKIGLAFEAGCIRRNPASGAIEVGLALRSATESFAPGWWHLPGSFYRLWEGPKDVLGRLIQKEFGRLTFRQAVCVGTFRASKEDQGKERGHTNSELWCILGADFDETRVRWVPADDLPEATFYSHRQTLIPQLVEAFLRFEQGDARMVPKLDVIRP